MFRHIVFTVISVCFAALFFVCGCGSSQAKSNDTTTTAAEPANNEPEAWQVYEHYMSKAGMAVAEERLDDALDYYLKAAQVLDDEGEVTVKRADAHYQAADMAYQRLQKELAIEEYQKAVDIYLRFTGNSKAKAGVALTNMGTIWKELSDYKKARKCWEQAIAIYKDAPQSGQTSIHIQKVEQNIRDLDEGF